MVEFLRIIFVFVLLYSTVQPAFGKSLVTTNKFDIKASNYERGNVIWSGRITVCLDTHR